MGEVHGVVSNWGKLAVYLSSCLAIYLYFVRILRLTGLLGIGLSLVYQVCNSTERINLGYYIGGFRNR